MNFRFLHAADLHIDSPMRGLARYEGAPVDAMRGATRRAFTNLVELAIRERVDFVVIAGDLYDGDWPDYNTGLFFAAGVARLAEEGIDVVVKRGNHDAASRITRALRLPQRVRMLSEREPETVVLEQIGVAIHGQSFPEAAVLRDLSAAYPPARAGMFNLGLLHTSLNGRPDHDPYAPTSADALRTRGYDYWALGHVHAAEIVARDPWIVYPGNAQGRHVRETGAKGCTLVTVAHGRVDCTFVPLDVVRWDSLTLDIGGCGDLDALLERASQSIRARVGAADGRGLALRIEIAGRGPLHSALHARPDQLLAEMRNAATGASGGLAWLEKLRVNSRATLDREALAGRDDPLGLLLRELDAIGTDPQVLRALAAESLAELESRLPAELVELRLSEDEGALRELLAEVEGLLLDRLAGDGTSR